MMRLVRVTVGLQRNQGSYLLGRLVTPYMCHSPTLAKRSVTVRLPRTRLEQALGVLYSHPLLSQALNISNLRTEK